MGPYEVLDSIDLFPVPSGLLLQLLEEIK